ncbi:MAG: hypothetical protein B7733_09375 [Myxococcales bacterium FL481]|nr:MAG: hypothetical protein B7733_09375 [Myxococcales bacterium FL481]
MAIRLDARSSRRRGLAGLLSLLAAGSVSWGAADRAYGAARPPDGWGLTQAADDPHLVEDRLRKLLRNPFSRRHWRPLVGSLGSSRFEARILRGVAQNPENPAWAILLARLELEQGRGEDAAQRLGELQGVPTRWREPLRALEVRALRAAGRDREAIERLVADPRAASLEDLERAFTIASERGFDARALALATELAQRRPEDGRSQQRLAELAAAAAQFDVADRAWEVAIAVSSGPRHHALVHRRAQTRLAASDPTAAAQLVWGLLANRRTGRMADRRAWWATLEQAALVNPGAGPWRERVGEFVARSGSRREPAALHLWGQLRVAGGESASVVWRELVGLAPSDARLRIAFVRGLESDGDVDQIVEQLQRFDFRRRENVEFALGTASRLAVNGEGDAAVAIADSVASARRASPEVSALLLEFFNTHGAADRALSVAKRWVARRPRDIEARLALGEQLFEMNEVDAALEQWAWLPKLTSPRHAGWARHAQVLAEHANAARGRSLRQQALGSLEVALAQAPREANYHRLRAILEEERRSYDGALDSWLAARRFARSRDQAVLEEESRTRIVELLVGLGLTRRDEAREQVESEARATMASPTADDASVLAAGRLLADLYSREDKPQAAVSVLRQLNERFPQDPERLFDLAAALRRAGGRDRLREANAILERVADVDAQRRADVLVEMSEIAFYSGDDSQALQRARTAVSEGDDGARALVRLGELHQHRGELTQAVVAYGEALRLRPRNVQAGLRLADLRLLAADAKAAMEIFAELIRHGDADELARADVQRLLDVAEAMNETELMLTTVVDRAQLATATSASSELALEVLERLEPEPIERWLRGDLTSRDPARVAAMRRVLLNALAQGSIGVRTRSAGQLAKLGLPDTAVPLARMGANLTAHRDTSAAIAQSYVRARVAALVAVGRLDDEEALPVLADVATRRGEAESTRHAALWGLANSSSPSAAAALRKAATMAQPADQQTLALACVGLARVGGDTAAVRRAVATAARGSAHRTVRRACAYAEMRLEAGGSRRWLMHDDELVRALAITETAWPAGADANGDATRIVSAALGPAGLVRDAAVARLTRAGQPGRPDLPRLRLVTDDTWALVVTRWLSEQATTPSLDDSDLETNISRSVVDRALRSNLAGTTAQRRYARRWLAGCEMVPADLGAAQQDEAALDCLVRTLSRTAAGQRRRFR